MAMQEEVMQCQTCGCGFSTMSRSLSAPNSLGTVVTLNVIRYYCHHQNLCVIVNLQVGCT